MSVCAPVSTLKKKKQIITEKQKQQKSKNQCCSKACHSSGLPNPEVMLLNCESLPRRQAKKMSEPKSLVSVKKTNLEQLVSMGDIAATHSTRVSALKNLRLEIPSHQKRQNQRKRLVRGKTFFERRPRKVILNRLGADTAEKYKDLQCNVQHTGYLCDSALQEESNNNTCMPVSFSSIDEGLQQNTFQRHDPSSFWSSWRTSPYLFSEEEYSDDSLSGTHSPFTSMSPCLTHSQLPEVVAENISCQRVKPFTGKTVWKCTCARTSVWTFLHKRHDHNNTEINADDQSLNWRAENDNETLCKKRKLDLLLDDLPPLSFYPPVPDLEEFISSSCSEIISNVPLDSGVANERISKPVLHEHEKDHQNHTILDTPSKTFTVLKRNRIVKIKSPTFRYPLTYGVEKEPNLNSVSLLNVKEGSDMSYCSPPILDYFSKVLPSETHSSPSSESTSHFGERFLGKDYALHYADASDSNSELEQSPGNKLALNDLSSDALNDAAPVALSDAVAVAQSDAVPVAPSDAVPVAPSDAVPVAPSDAVPVAPSDAVPVAPSDAVPVAPSDAVPVAPSDAVPVAPSDAVPVAPSDAAPVAPSDAAPVAPSDAAPVAPSDAAPVAPSDAAPVAPSDAAPVAPSDSTPFALSDAMPFAPTDAASGSPSDATPFAPSDATPFAPSDATPVAPSDAASGSPSEATLFVPSDVAPVPPSDAAPGSPSDAAPFALSDAVPFAQSDAASGSPSDATPFAPRDAASGCPSDATPVAPSDAASGSPSDVTLFAPSDVSPVPPRDAASGSPSDATPFAPSDATPFAPSDATPFAPSDATPFAPSDSTPFAPSDATPFAPSDATPFPPSDATPFPPIDAASVSPSDATPFAPSDATPVDPIDAAFDSPSDAMPFAPSDAKPVALSDAASGALSDAASGSPSDAAPFAPSDAAPFAPSDAAPFAPSDAAPFAPSDAAHFAPSDAAPFAPSDARPDLLSDARPDLLSDAAPFVLSDAAPFVLSDAAPFVLSDAAPFVLSDAAPFVLSDAAPFVLSDAAPFVLSDAAPFVLSDAAPFVLSDVAPFVLNDFTLGVPSDATPSSPCDAAPVAPCDAASSSPSDAAPSSPSDTALSDAPEDDVLIIDVIPDDPDLFGCLNEQIKSPQFCSAKRSAADLVSKEKLTRNILPEAISPEHYSIDSPMEICTPEATPVLNCCMFGQDQKVSGTRWNWTRALNSFSEGPGRPEHLTELEDQDPVELPNQGSSELIDQTETLSGGGEHRLPQNHFCLQTEPALNETRLQWMHNFHRKEDSPPDVMIPDSWENCTCENKFHCKPLQIRLPHGYCRSFFRSSYGCYRGPLCTYLHVPKESDEKLCMDVLRIMINEKRTSFLQRAFLVFREYYSKYLHRTNFDEGVFDALLDQLLKRSWRQEVLHLLETATSANILPSVENVIKVFEHVACYRVQAMVPNLMGILSKCLDLGMILTLPQINHITEIVTQLPNSRAAITFLLSVKSKIEEHLPKKNLEHYLEAAMGEIEHCKVNSDWVKLGTLYVNICTGRENLTDLKNFSQCIAEALMKESIDDRPDVPYCEFADTIFKHPQLNEVHKTIVGRIGISVMFFYYRKELWLKGRRVLYKFHELKINYKVLKGIAGREIVASRCAIVNVAVEIFLMGGRLNSAVQTLRECDWNIHSAVWPCDQMDVLKRHSLLCSIVQEALCKSMYSLCFEVLQNLPGFKESQAEFNVSQYSLLFNKVLACAVSNRSLSISSSIVDFMVLKKIPIDYINLHELITALGHSGLWRKARDQYKRALSLGFYPPLDEHVNSTILYIPSFMSAIEMLLTIERFMVSNSSIIQLPGGCSQNLQIILRKISKEEDSSKDKDNYHAASERLLEASRLSSPRLFIKHLTVNNRNEQVYTLDHNCCVKWLNGNRNWAVKVWSYH
ncbi:protein TOPAZ1 [Lithobates pipiens]